MIHVLGAGAIGSLVASSLAPRLPVSLILRNQKALTAYKAVEETIRVRSHGTDFATRVPAVVAADPGPIERLVVTTKAHQTLGAIKRVRPFIQPGATILLLQNGLGVQEQLESELWPAAEPASPSTLETARPTFIQAITSNGVRRSTLPWSFQHYGREPVVFLSPPQNTRTAKELEDALLTNKKLLLAEKLDATDFLVRQYEKLVVNTCINPLTALLGCKNGRLLQLGQRRYMERIINESCEVLTRSAAASQPAIARAVSAALTPERMTRVVVDVCRATAENTSSMLADVQHGRPTEIDFINGYITRQAHHLQQSSIFNTSLVSLVKMRQEQQAWQLEHGFIPLETI